MSHLSFPPLTCSYLQPVETSNLHSIREELLNIFLIKLPKLLKEAQRLVYIIFTRVAKVGTVLPPQMAQMTSQPKSKQREILNWPIREQEKIITMVISQSALAQVISQSALARILAHTYQVTNQNVQPKRNGKMSK